MDQDKTEIVICLGSSCFARGNKKMVTVIQHILKQYHLEDRVFLRGAHCFGDCGEGPSIRIGGRLIRAASEEEVERLIKEYFQA